MTLNQIVFWQDSFVQKSDKVEKKKKKKSIAINCQQIIILKIHK